MRTVLLTLFFMGCGKSSNPGFGSGGAWIPPGSDAAEGNTGSDAEGTEGTSSSNDTGTTTEADADTGAGDNSDDADGDLGGLNGDDGSGSSAEDTGVVIEPTGYDRGDVAHNLTATDQTGIPFSLHALYGQNVAITVGNMNVATTTATLEGIQDISSEHPGVRFVAFIGYDADGVQCNQLCASEIASTYGYSTVLFDPSLTLATLNTWIDGANTQTYLIDGTMGIHWKKSGTANSDVVSGRLEEIE